MPAKIAQRTAADLDAFNRLPADWFTVASVDDHLVPRPAFRLGRLFELGLVERRLAAPFDRMSAEEFARRVASGASPYEFRRFTGDADRRPVHPASPMLASPPSDERRQLTRSEFFEALCVASRTLPDFRPLGVRVFPPGLLFEGEFGIDPEHPGLADRVVLSYELPFDHEACRYFVHPGFPLLSLGHQTHPNT